MARILIVDDQDNTRRMLWEMLSAEGYEVDQAANGALACTMVAENGYDLVITDLRMGDVGGLEVLRRTRETSPLTEVIVMTAFGTIEDAVAAMRFGAHDFVQKPFVEEELLIKVARAARTRQLAGELRAMAADFRDRYNFGNIIGQSAEIRDVLGRIVRIAPTDATVLITGESGTGKELVARAIHANSLRAERPFVSINCAALTETLLESELFGHMRGAFTGAVQTRKGLFEEANGGTFFFDEIAETPPSLQAKLLRAIQEGEIRRLGTTSQSTSMRASSLRPTRTSESSSRKNVSAKTCTTASTSRVSSCRLYENAKRTSLRSSTASSRNTARRWADKPPWGPASWTTCSAMISPGTFESSKI